MSTALEQKIAKLKELGIDTPQGILSLITSGGIDTPAKRQVLTGVMDNPALNTTSDWTFDVDGKTKDYTFTGDAMPNEMAVQNMRDAHGITADISKLGIGDRGLNTPAEREFIMKQQAFEAELTKLSSADLSSVLELFQGLSPQEKDTYMNHVIENGFNYGTINESAPLRQQGFPQYNTGTGNLSNLGFAGYR